MFSKACEYGIRAALYIALRSLDGERVSLKSIVSEVGSPEAFTAKILQQLARDKIVESVKGPGGGFQIPRDKIDSIMLSQIVFAMDGDSNYHACGLGLKECDDSQPCPLHDKFIIIRSELKEMLENTSLYELATGLDIGLTSLKG